VFLQHVKSRCWLLWLCVSISMGVLQSWWLWYGYPLCMLWIFLVVPSEIVTDFLNMALLHFDHLCYEIRYTIVASLYWIYSSAFWMFRVKENLTCTVTKIHLCFVEWFLCILQHSMSWSGDCCLCVKWQVRIFANLNMDYCVDYPLCMFNEYHAF